MPIHLVAALMALLLFLEPLAQRLHELVPAAHGLDLLLFFFGQEFLGELLQPLLRNVHVDPSSIGLEALEHVAEHLVEPVEVALVLHQRGAREIVEIINAARRQIGVHGLQQRQILAQCHRHTGRFELLEETDEHLLPAFDEPYRH